VSKRVAGIDVLDELAKSGCPNSSGGREKWGTPKIFDPKYFRSPKQNFRATSNFKYGTALLREGRINTKFIARFLRFSHAKSSPKRSPVCVLARAVGSGVSVNARQSPVAKSETFRPVPGGNGASEVVVKWTDRLPRPELWGSCRTSFSISVRVRPVYSRGSPYTLCYTSSAG
jgi:hypothetical protein